MMKFKIKIYSILSWIIFWCTNPLFGSTVSSLVISESSSGIVIEKASGYVFHDVNKNGEFDKREKGIAGVAISNGIDIVETNRDGYYSIPVTDDSPVFVIKPKNWMTPLNNLYLPQFYYLHKPKGSPSGFQYKGINPTRKLPEYINFPLYKVREKSNFKILVFGDTQPYSVNEVDYVAEDVIHEIIGRKDITLGMTMGDIVGDSLPLLSLINDAVAQMKIPWYNVMGNHDINYDAESDSLSDETFESIYGPATYAFTYGDVHFIVIDDVIYFGTNSSNTRYTGGLRLSQLTFIKNYLGLIPKNDLIVLTMHIPFIQHGDAFRKNDQDKLFGLLKDHPYTLSVSAHTHVHQNLFFNKDLSGWQQPVPHHQFNVGAVCGSWWKGQKGEKGIPHTMMRDGTPNGYAIISFEGNNYTIDWKVAGSPEGHQMNIHTSREITAESDEDPKLTVNFFNGDESSIVEYRIDDNPEWKLMKKVIKYDPYYIVLGSMSNPEPCSHLWEAPLGTYWCIGRHLVQVRAKDRYGHVFIDYHTFRVISKY